VQVGLCILFPCFRIGSYAPKHIYSLKLVPSKQRGLGVRGRAHYPTELISASASHMVATIVLFDMIFTLRTRLGGGQNFLRGCLFFVLSLLATKAVIVLLACFAFMPINVVYDTMPGGTIVAREYWPIDAGFVDLTIWTGRRKTPCKIWDCI
jgi:hypothetical protein